VVGYLSGLATGAGVEFWGAGATPRGEMDPEGAFRWIDRYCADYPMNTTAVASRNLFFERTGRGPVKQ
jgi:hypothetical protein